MDSVLNEDQELVILSANTVNKLVQIIDNDFDDFTNLCKTVIAYYDEGIKKWKEFLGEVKDRKLYPLVFTIIELDDNINKMEVILSETEEKVNSNVEQYSIAIYILRQWQSNEFMDHGLRSNANFELHYGGCFS